MPPRYSYWTILAGGLPTAFRAAEREDLLPTFQRIKEKHPDAEMKWFARGKLWESQEAARAPEKQRGARTRDWRPGGDHRDPRQKFIDAKKQRNAVMRKERWDRKNAPPRERPQGAPPREEARPRSELKKESSHKPWQRKRWIRGQGTEEPRQPPRPRGPNREPKPSEEPEPTPPPREKQPTVPPPGPPERGYPRRRFQPRGRFPKGPRD